MKKNYFITLTLLFLSFIGNIYAQAGLYNFAASTGAFTPITGGTALTATVADDAISASTPIGFSFDFDGATFTTFKASSNGFLSFGSGTASNSTNSATVGAISKPLLAPLWDDLDGGNTGSAATYIVTGTAPNRVFTMEWLNYEWSYNSSSDDISFQIKLYEITNVIEFIYRDDAGTLISPDGTIGIMGASSYLTLNNSSATATASNSFSLQILQHVLQQVKCILFHHLHVQV